MKRFRGGLVSKAQRLCVSLNSRLESNKEEKKKSLKYERARRRYRWTKMKSSGPARPLRGPTVHRTPYTLYPTPYTLHPTPYTLHPTPIMKSSGPARALRGPPLRPYPEYSRANSYPWSPSPPEAGPSRTRSSRHLQLSPIFRLFLLENCQRTTK